MTARRPIAGEPLNTGVGRPILAAIQFTTSTFVAAPSSTPTPRADSKHPRADSTFLSRRELCFTLDGDIFVRYLSFRDASSLRAAVSSRVPAKIDVGPVYTVDPARRAAYGGTAPGGGKAFAPVEREFVIDVDLTDYDDVRPCALISGEWLTLGRRRAPGPCFQRQRPNISIFFLPALGALATLFPGGPKAAAPPHPSPPHPSTPNHPQLPRSGRAAAAGTRARAAGP